MALTDVSFLLFDPMFCDPVVVLREIEEVDDDGIAQRRIQRINIVASIQAESGDNLDIGPDSARASGSYEILTTFPLTVASDTTAADEVLWGGRLFVVTSIQRFGNFGAGTYEGTMQLKSLTGRIGAP